MSRPVTHALIYLKTPLPRPPRNIISGRIKWEALGNKSRETGGQVRLTCMREGPRSKQDSEAGADGGGGGTPPPLISPRKDPESENNQQICILCGRNVLREIMKETGTGQKVLFINRKMHTCWCGRHGAGDMSHTH